MTRSRRHPAQASRIAAAGLSAATMLSVVAVLGASRDHATEQAATDQVATAPAPAKVAVTRRQSAQPPPTTARRPSRHGTARQRAPRSSVPDTTTAPS